MQQNAHTLKLGKISISKNCQRGARRVVLFSKEILPRSE
jgi:hypothetical protein